MLLTLLNNPNVSLCGQKSVQLIKESRLYATVNSEDTFTESVMQVKIYVT